MKFAEVFFCSFTFYNEKGKGLEGGNVQVTSQAVGNILSEYADVFNEPDQLPSKHDKHHKIYFGGKF